MEQPQAIVCRIREKSWRAKIAGWVLRGNQTAIVFGNTIHLCNTTTKEFLANKEWVCHELAHVLQYRQYGYFGFLRRYIWECIKHGYYKNRFEKEARAEEKNYQLLEGASFLPA
jgi:Domain of unknown function (DUF4157)